MTTILSNPKLRAAISHKGAELVSLLSINPEREYIWEGNPEFWGKHSPILFPIVGTLKDNSYSYNNKVYQLPRHGFARDMVFELISRSPTEAVFSLLSDEITKEVYSFDFELQLLYSLQESRLKLTYKVINKGTDTMYYSIGGHPALALAEAFEEYSLEFDANQTLTAYELENDLVSDKTKEIELDNHRLPLTYGLFEKDALIFKQLESKNIRLLENGKPLLDFRFTDFPDFGIWTKRNAPFICLEPWVGYSDTLNSNGDIADKEGIQVLEGTSSKEYSFSIEIV